MDRKRFFGLFVAILTTLLILPAVAGADPPITAALQKQRFKWIVTKRLTVINAATFNGLLTVNDELHVDNDRDSVALNVQGHSTQNYDLVNVEQSDGTDKFDIDNYGQTDIHGERDATTGSDAMLDIDATLGGVTTTANTTGMYVLLNRAAGSGDGSIVDAGVMVRMDTDAITTTAGGILVGTDIEVQADDSSDQTILAGAWITADTEITSTVDQAYGARLAVSSDYVVTTTMNVLDILLHRGYATDPQNEWGINIRATGTAGGGQDAAIRVASDGTGTNDDWGYIVDMDPSEVLTAELRFSQGETVENLTDGEIGVNADLEVTGASDFQGVIADSTGDLTVDDSLDIEANLDVTGTADIAGDLQVADNITVTGDADEVQLTVTGFTTQTLDLFVVENSAGADILAASLSTVTVDGGVLITGVLDVRDVVHDGAGDLTIQDALVIVGTTDARGDVQDSLGVFTVADDADVTGEFEVTDCMTVTGDADEIQLSVTANAANTMDVFVVENSAGADIVAASLSTVTVDGGVLITGVLDVRDVVHDGAGDLTIQDALVIVGTTDARGDVQDSLGVFTVADDADVTGEFEVTDCMTVTGDADEIQLTVVANSVQTQDVISITNSAGAPIVHANLSQLDVDANLVVTGTSDLRGNVFDEGGAFIVADNAVISGTADAVQLTITGDDEQTGNVFVVEAHGGTDHVTIDQGGNVVISGTLDQQRAVSSSAGRVQILDNMLISNTQNADVLTINGYHGLTNSALVIEAHDGTDHLTVDQGGSVMISGTLDVQGNVSDSNSEVTIEDNAVITGTADLVQLTITGYHGQTAALLVAEAHDGTDHFAVDQGGNVVISGTLDQRGVVWDSTSALTVEDNAVITGTQDVIQLSITGWHAQTGNVFVIEDHNGTDHFTVDQGGNTVISGTTDLQQQVSDSNSALTFADNVVISGTANANVQLIVEATANQTADILQLEGTAGTDALQVDYLGQISSDTGNVVIDDDFTINDTTDITPVTWDGICDGLTCVAHPCPSGVLTNTTYIFDSAGNAGVTLDTAGSTAGQITTWTSIDAGQTISIYVGHAPGGATVQQLDDGDSATFMYSGSEWITIAYINN